MTSIVPGYNYDIFISYRQKDNRHDGWVTEFVDNLKGELESTFKEEISVYFDINPHDGLLETHDVDESLKEKLKCLIFIPIISRTYCDPKSFAWDHEFKAFVAMASNDQFGLKVKLPNGNVASRVLPVKIHNLAADDNKMLEGCLESHLRGIEFIYSEPGVNRPLKPDDDEKLNLNHTRYRNQINKTANSIGEILTGLQSFGTKTTQPISAENIILPGKSSRLKMKSGKIILSSLIICALITAAYALFFTHDPLQKNKSSGNRIAIVVLPFQNLTGDTGKDYWQIAIQENITTFLSNLQNDLIIRQISTVNPVIQSKGIQDYSSITNSFAREISDNLDAKLYVTGSFQLAGTDYRVNAKLVEVETSRVLKPFEISLARSEMALREISDTLRKKIADFLVVSNFARQMTPDYQDVNIASPEAYKYFIEGERAFRNDDFGNAESNYLKAIAIDPDYFAALGTLCLLYQSFNMDAKAIETWNMIPGRDKLSRLNQAGLDYVHACLFESSEECVKYAKKLLEFDDHQPTTMGDLGSFYYSLGEYDNAIAILKEGIKIVKEWKSDHIWGNYLYKGLAYSYHKTHQYKKEQRIYAQAKKIFPEDFNLTEGELILALTLGENKKARNLIELLTRLAPKSNTEGDIATRLAECHSRAGKLDEAQKYYQRACDLDPQNSLYLKNLALFLFDNKRNIPDGFRKIDEALALDPGNSVYLDTKGWGLYRTGRHQEAYDMLLRADSCKILYHPDLVHHLDTVRNALNKAKE